LLVRADEEATLTALTARTGWSQGEVLSRSRPLVAAERLVAVGQPPALFIHAERFGSVTSRILETLERFHAQNPLIRGLAKEDLRGRVASGAGQASRADPASRAEPLLSAALFNAALQFLGAQGKIGTEGEMVRLAGREVRLSTEESAAKESISRAFEQAGLAVPAASEVLARLPVDRVRAEKIFQILLREKALVKVSEGLVFHHSALDRLRQLLARRKTQTDRMDVTAFKEMTGVTRKYAIPLLEYLDRERVTRRQGDVRIIL
jgi:selenocysteine-specific elongation factor